MNNNNEPYGIEDSTPPNHINTFTISSTLKEHPAIWCDMTKNKLCALTLLANGGVICTDIVILTRFNFLKKKG